MASIYADTSVVDGVANAGTVGDPTSLRDAFSKVTSPNDRILFSGGTATIDVATNGPITTGLAGIAGFPIEVIGYDPNAGVLAELGETAFVLVSTSGNVTEDVFQVDHPFWSFRNVGVLGGRTAINVAADAAQGMLISNCGFLNCGQSAITMAAASVSTNPMPFTIQRCYVNAGCTDAAIRADCDGGFIDHTWIVYVANDGIALGGTGEWGSHLSNIYTHYVGGIGLNVNSRPLTCEHSIFNTSNGAGAFFSTPQSPIVFRAVGFADNAGSGNQVDAALPMNIYFDHCAFQGSGAPFNPVTITAQGAPGNVIGDADFVNAGPVGAALIDARLGSSSQWSGVGPNIQTFDNTMNQQLDIGLIHPAGSGQGILPYPVHRG